MAVGLVVAKRVIKSVSIGKYPAKQRCLLLRDKDTGTLVLNIERFILTDSASDDEEGFVKVFSYNGKHLYRTGFSIKIDSLSLITNWLYFALEDVHHTNFEEE